MSNFDLSEYNLAAGIFPNAFSNRLFFLTNFPKVNVLPFALGFLYMLTTSALLPFDLYFYFKHNESPGYKSRNSVVYCQMYLRYTAAYSSDSHNPNLHEVTTKLKLVPWAFCRVAGYPTLIYALDSRQSRSLGPMYLIYGTLHGNKNQ